MTVREMISNLEALIAKDACVADASVVADGCDCWGDALRVRVIDGSRLSVLVERADNVPRAEGGLR